VGFFVTGESVGDTVVGEAEEVGLEESCGAKVGETDLVGEAVVLVGLAVVGFRVGFLVGVTVMGDAVGARVSPAAVGARVVGLTVEGLEEGALLGAWD
jgi:hypothetical protein